MKPDEDAAVIANRAILKPADGACQKAYLWLGTGTGLGAGLGVTKGDIFTGGKSL